MLEAEQVYRDDLGLSGKVQRCARHPNNVWALHGREVSLSLLLRPIGSPNKLSARSSLAVEILAAGCHLPISQGSMPRRSTPSSISTEQSISS
ncbi:hypothetical protein LB558_02045 [Mesorhizobium sp. CO1-1-8]|nr:hypothetical protein [Mesorhizobium sp. CO1-1-8]MBZ9771302.1 hypothetical protein [Mesorhizobium sp. CO1-1-8]